MAYEDAIEKAQQQAKRNDSLGCTLRASGAGAAVPSAGPLVEARDRLQGQIAALCQYTDRLCKNADFMFGPTPLDEENMGVPLIPYGGVMGELFYLLQDMDSQLRRLAAQVERNCVA